MFEYWTIGHVFWTDAAYASQFYRIYPSSLNSQLREYRRLKPKDNLRRAVSLKVSDPACASERLSSLGPTSQLEKT